MAYGLAFGLLRVFSVLINPIKSYYGVSDTTAMLAPGIGMFGYSIGGLLGGPLLQTIGNREGSMIFGFVAAIAFLLCGLVPNIYFILGMIFVALFSLGVVYLGTSYIFNYRFPNSLVQHNNKSAIQLLTLKSGSGNHFKIFQRKSDISKPAEVRSIKYDALLN